MEVDIDPLLVLEQFMQVNEQDDTTNAEIMDEEMFELTDLEQNNVTILEPNLEDNNISDENVNSATVDDSSVNDDPFPLSTPIFDIENIIDKNQGSTYTDSVVSNNIIDKMKHGFMSNDKPADRPANSSLLERKIKSQKSVVKKRAPVKKKMPIKKTKILSQSQQYLLNVQNLSTPSNEEMVYRHKLFPIVDKVVERKLDCTVCGTHIGCRSNMKTIYIIHPLLKVLVCSTCKNKYTARDWTVNNIKKDSNCRWCGKPPSDDVLLYECCKCPFGFCKLCVSRNFIKFDLTNQSLKKEWECLVCRMTPLYYQRAIAWGLETFVTNLSKRNVKGPSLIQDLSKCCQSVEVNEVTTIGECMLVKQTNGLPKEKLNTSSVSNEGNHMSEFVNSFKIQKSHSTIKIQRYNTKPLDVAWPKTRIASLFKQIEDVKGTIVLKFKDTPLTNRDLKKTIDDTKFLLKYISKQASDCATVLDKWVVDSCSNGPTNLNRIETATVKSPVNVPLKINLPKENIPVQSVPVTNVPVTTIHTVPSIKRNTITHSSVSLTSKKLDNKELFKKYNIKPCSVILERCKVLDEIEKERGSLLMSLLEDSTIEIQDSEMNLFVPQVELIETKPTSDFNSLISNTDEDCIIIDD